MYVHPAATPFFVAAALALVFALVSIRRRVLAALRLAGLRADHCEAARVEAIEWHNTLAAKVAVAEMRVRDLESELVTYKGQLHDGDGLLAQARREREHAREALRSQMRRADEALCRIEAVRRAIDPAIDHGPTSAPRDCRVCGFTLVDRPNADTDLCYRCE